MPDVQGTTQTIWGWPVMVYLFLAGAGAGAYLTAWWGERGKTSPVLVAMGRWLATPLVAVGTALLVFDLGAGRMHPLRILGLYTHPESIMTLGTWILSIFLILSALDGYGYLVGLGRPRWLPPLTAIFAVGVALYTGVLLGIIQAIPFWNSALLPVLFVVSACSTGMAATFLGGLLVSREVWKDVESFQGLHLGLVVTEAVLLALFLYFAANGPEAARLSVELLVRGPFAAAFWLAVVGAGLVLPILFQLLTRVGSLSPVLRQPFWLALESVLVLVGGFYLRFLVVAGGVPQKLL
ncbi:MAG: polysulfide reductase NrfD [Bacillota bacterium]|nr:polysulfide reductase NrfD [Bacillota bacterium]